MATIKIAFATNNGGLDDTIADRFGRTQTFTIVEVDTETGEIKNVEVVDNPGYAAGSGAGVKAAQTVAEKGAKVYAGPQPGPNAYAALQHLGVKVITITGTTVREALKIVLQQLKEEQ
ncbi:NifB/NifX family molybdenum-iron cluster-binding protein [Pyrofollis japonicus]|uniref:NifB/NifX family molybdenum-iron cluster-binding protein n=1 Tax=Pyrofollis japonicus TaxID=3060460 RepID=UPI00295BE5FE|nr:NifB/NifX family molybdenum-iron cluster-binding protein [Pyrofollis japonicus]BEP16681.1 NifB/NifX family molybdenum-iron cluster-binding protein [Pyrofollis japonicus]